MIEILSLFSGIGAFEKALTNLKIEYKVINYCEIDKYASKAYCLIHNEDENKNLWDITKVNEKELPDFNLMTYGFPCQPFSMAGLRNGKEHKSGNLFFDSMRIAEYKKPEYMIAENVKGLLSIDNGKYLQEIINYLGNIGYNNYFKVLNAKDYGIPQNRERIFIISIRKDIDNLNFDFPKKQELKIFLRDIKDTNVIRLNRYKMKNNFYCNKIIKNNKLLDNENICQTLTTKQYRHPNSGYFSYDGFFRFLTPFEETLLSGFSKNDFNKIENNISFNKIEKLMGNTIVVNVLEAIFKQLFLNENKKQKWLF